MRKIINFVVLFILVFGMFSCKKGEKYDIWASADIPLSEIDEVVSKQMKNIAETYIMIDEKKYSHLEGDVDGGKLVIAFEGGTGFLGFIKSELKPDGNIKIVMGESTFIGSGLKVIEKNDNTFMSGIVKDGMSEKEYHIKILLNESLIGSGTTRLEIEKNKAILTGVLGTKSYLQIKDLIRNYPKIKTLILKNVPGSMNDPVNMHVGRLIRNAGLKIVVPSDSEIASGGVDLFCAGTERVVESGAKLGIHSWYFDGISAGDLPKDHQAHKAQIKYFTEMMGEKGKDFYFHTLDVASSNDIHWMTKDELIEWKLISVSEDYKELISDSLNFKYKNETMNLLVEGNRKSKKILIILHGGPGGSSLQINNADNFSEIMEKNFLVAYWDQRGSGLSTGKDDVSLFTVHQFVDDLDYLIELLFSKYGKGNKIYLLGASWGGYLGVAYLEDNARQKKISGWIEMNGVNDFHNNDRAIRSEIVKNADEKIRQGINKEKWIKIKNVALSFNVSVQTVSQSYALEEVAEKANKLLVTIEEKIKFSSELSRDRFTKRPDELNNALVKDAMFINPDLSKINIPTLMLWGEYDMVVPLILGKKDLMKYSSKDKRLKIFKKAGHLPMFNYPKETAEEIINFVLAH